MSIIPLFLVVCMLIVLWLDSTRYTIPNWLVGLLLLAYPFAVFTAPAPVEWQTALIGAAITLVLGYGLFALRWMGGGDVKLLAALALWVGISSLLDFMLTVAILGGILSLALIVLRKAIPHLPLGERKLPRLLREGQPVPYGIAIAFAFLLLIWGGKIPVLGG